MAATISSDELQTLWRIAEAMNASGDYKGKQDRDGKWSGVTTNEQAFNRILIGRDLGLSPAQAMMGIDLVRGNLQIRAVLLASFVRQSRMYDYKVVKHDERECTLEFYRIDTWSEANPTPGLELLGTSTFTIEDAAHAKLIRPNSPWETVPRNMVFARAMSNGVKWYCPDLLGGVPVYTEGDDLEREGAPAIGAGEEGEAPGWKGVSVSDAAAVAKIVRRAQRLGHGGLSNLAAAQMALNDQSRESVAQWIETATAALDQMVQTAEQHHEPDEAEDAAEVAKDGAHLRYPEDEPETGAQGYAVPRVSAEDADRATGRDESADRDPVEPEPDDDRTEAGKQITRMTHAPEPDDEPIPGQQTLADDGGIDVPPKVKKPKEGE